MTNVCHTCLGTEKMQYLKACIRGCEVLVCKHRRTEHKCPSKAGAAETQKKSKEMTA